MDLVTIWQKGNTDKLEETVIVIMLKDKQTGFLEKELTCCAVEGHEELLLNAYASDEGDGLYVILKLTCAGEVSDETFDLIYDCYDAEIFDSLSVECSEVEGCFNPTWEFVFKYDEALIETKINEILRTHAKELTEVFEAVYNDA